MPPSNRWRQRVVRLYCWWAGHEWQDTISHYDETMCDRCGKQHREF